MEKNESLEILKDMGINDPLAQHAVTCKQCAKVIFEVGHRKDLCDKGLELDTEAAVESYTLTSFAEFQKNQAVKEALAKAGNLHSNDVEEILNRIELKAKSRAVREAIVEIRKALRELL